jgi:hypothetical protein
VEDRSRPAGEHRSTRGFDGEDANARPSRFEDFTDTRDGPSSPDGRDEEVHGTSGIVPDLDGRGSPVDLHIRWVAELVEHHGAGKFVDEVSCLGDGVGHEDAAR